MSTPTTIPEFEVNEETTPQVTGQLKDETGADLALTSLDTITLTLFVPKTGTIVNSRNKQNVKNVNNVTIGSTGIITWAVQTADLAIIDTTDTENDREVHRALFEFATTATPAVEGAKQFDLVVHNLQKVP